MIDNLVVKLVLLSLSCQMYFDNSVLLKVTQLFVSYSVKSVFKAIHLQGR